MSICKSCGAEIRWVVTEKGKRMPVDERPVVDGRFVVDEHDNAFFVKDRDSVSGPLYTSHFQTCPNADQHRKVRS